MHQFETIQDSLLVRAPAKINLSLLVTGKRPDGFHGLRTIMAKVDWYDNLLFEHAEQDGIDLLCQGSYWAPTSNENLIYKAITKLCEIIGKPPKIKITLTKNIPAGSGLGSASSDAAAALIGYNKFENLNLPIKTLTILATQLGSDVPFFLGGTLALCEGRGEKLTNIGHNYNFKTLLVLPGINTSTKGVYEHYIHDSALFERLNSKFQQHLTENRLDLIVKMCANMLEESCFGLHPEIAGLKYKIEQLGLTPLCLSGSGSTLYHILQDGDTDLSDYQSTLKSKFGCDSVIVKNNDW